MPSTILWRCSCFPSSLYFCFGAGRVTVAGSRREKDPWHRAACRIADWKHDMFDEIAKPPAQAEAIFACDFPA